MNIAISGIGLATAQGSSGDIRAGETPHPPEGLPWKANGSNISQICFRARGLDSALSGAERLRALAHKALADLGEISVNTPLLIGSCNGASLQSWEQSFDTNVLFHGTQWSNGPVFSSSCASGVHALYAAKQLLSAGAVDEALVLAVDVLSKSNHENFESLRVLAEKPSAPWQSNSNGFILGEAAVVLKLTRAGSDDQLLVSGPELGSDLAEHDGLTDVLENLSFEKPSLILGQGTGPFQNDTNELAALAAFVEKTVPLATPLVTFGHSLGASSLLSIALGALGHRASRSFLTSPSRVASDGRPLSSDSWTAGDVLTICRALNGACAATLVGGRAVANTRRRRLSWRKPSKPEVLMNPTLRVLAAEAFAHRPPEPPDVLILRLEKPLSPPPAAIIGGRLLPSAVLEITPGFASQLIARRWGFSGPALCLVGDPDAEVYGLKSALRESDLNVFQVNLRGSGDNRASEWNV